jgi:hypothetical protein
MARMSPFVSDFKAVDILQECLLHKFPTSYSITYRFLHRGRLLSNLVMSRVLFLSARSGDWRNEVVPKQVNISDYVVMKMLEWP